MLLVGPGVPKEADVSLSAIAEERQMGFDSSCQHLEFSAMDRIVFPGQQPPVGHLHDHYGTLAGPDSTLSKCGNPPVLATGPKIRPATG